MLLRVPLPLARRAGRPISVSAVPVGPGIDIGALLSISWEVSFVFWHCFLGVCVGFCLVELVLIIAGFGILVGKSAVMGLRLGLVRRLTQVFWIPCL